MMICKTPTQWRNQPLPIVISIVFLLLFGCSSTPEPIAEMAAAKTSLTAAEGEETTHYAPVAMDRAKQKLKRAESAIAKEDYDEARRLAEEAQADAELAQAIAAKTQTEKAVKELENSIQVLREEIMRARSR
ncbi:MAG: DUF4398 domain-containing protein [Candidatus Thiodiazotropha sp. (ex Dulcina madagascariensis)]|nr:DUF4398 domain-containing protein [Candidatus Thiodiazotropha sp. (ex Epidulcina cf. delphinae)]MCU7922857.1 DUF4398 domain-containing protein [Candidatus Thiodiazotropha sp. (ex Dulcina madagascariensis)]MCU7925649.1 DUF4398 domain-containing protein [Candidatus Thiodiazotropha sp. (ex Dulcina madagascariensis)]